MAQPPTGKVDQSPIHEQVNHILCFPQETSLTADVPNIAGKAMTVRGPIEPDQLGITLMHEHLFVATTRDVRDRTTTLRLRTGGCGIRN